MYMTINMPVIMKCSVNECTYNNDGGCHARAITIGDGNTPHCDTLYTCGTHCKSKGTAGVGACKVSGCLHNVDFECQAPSISVGMSGGHAMCMSCKM